MYFGILLNCYLNTTFLTGQFQNNFFYLPNFTWEENKNFFKCGLMNLKIEFIINNGPIDSPPKMAS